MPQALPQLYIIYTIYERSVPRLKTVTKIEILYGAGNGQRSLELWKILISVPGEIQETEDDYHGDLNYEAWLEADEARMCVCVCMCV